MLFTYLVYNTILLFVIVFGYFVKVSANRSSEYISRTIVFLSIVIPASIRKGIGTDYWAYIDLYNLYRNNTDDHELGFQFLGIWMNSWGFDPQAFISVLAILAFFPVCYIVPKKNFFPFIVIYFLIVFLNCMSTSRQVIALGFIVCGIFLLYKKKGNWKYLFCATLAFLFHYSSILYFPLLFLKNFKISRLTFWILIGSILILSSGTYFIESIFNNQLFLDSPYGGYVLSSYNRETSIGSGMGVALNLILPFLFLLLNKKIRMRYMHTDFFVILTLCYIFTYLLALKIHIFGRLLQCFIFVPAFIFIPVCKTLYPRYSKLVIIVFFLVYLILFEKNIYANQLSLGAGLGVSPYMTVFD